jgi:hypothetical protein
MAGVAVEIQNIKEDDGQLSSLRSSLKANWEKYGELDDDHNRAMERIIKLEAKVELMK